MKGELSNEELHAKVQAIAQYLPGWHHEVPRPGDEVRDHYALLVNDRGRAIAVHGPRWSRKPGRLTFSPQVPFDHNGHLPYGRTAPSITVSIDRRPVDAAKDIYNRLAADAIDYLEAVEAEADDDAAALASRKAYAESLAAIVGGKASKDGSEVSWNDGAQGYGTIRVLHRGGVSEILIRSVSDDVAAKLVAVIGEARS